MTTRHGIEPAIPARESVNHCMAREVPPYPSSIKLSNSPIITPLYKVLLRCSAHLPFLKHGSPAICFFSLPYVFFFSPYVCFLVQDCVSSDCLSAGPPLWFPRASLQLRVTHHLLGRLPSLLTRGLSNFPWFNRSKFLKKKLKWMFWLLGWWRAGMVIARKPLVLWAFDSCELGLMSVMIAPSVRSVRRYWGFHHRWGGCQWHLSPKLLASFTGLETARRWWGTEKWVRLSTDKEKPHSFQQQLLSGMLTNQVQMKLTSCFFFFK